MRLQVTELMLSNAFKQRHKCDLTITTLVTLISDPWEYWLQDVKF